MAIVAHRPSPAAPPPDGADRWADQMAAAQAGNGGAYHRLLSEIEPWLHRFYARRLPPAMVDDAVQEAMIAVHTKRHTFEPGRPFRPWLAAVARYKWIDRLRAMKRDTTDALEEGQEIAVPDHGSAVMSTMVLDRLLAQLKPAQAAVIRMVKLRGLSIAEAAAASGQSGPLVKVNIHRGMAKLTALMAADRASE